MLNVSRLIAVTLLLTIYTLAHTSVTTHTTTSSSLTTASSQLSASSSSSFLLYAAAQEDDFDDDFDGLDDEEDDDDDDDVVVIGGNANSGPKEFRFEDTEATTYIWNLIHSHNVEGVQQLLQKDADLPKYRSKDGRSALHWAYEYNYKDLQDILIAAGADEDAEDIDGNKPADMADRDEL